MFAYLLDENEFLGPHGIRSLSRYHLKDLFVFHVGGEEYKVQYLPGESKYRNVRRRAGTGRFVKDIPKAAMDALVDRALILATGDPQSSAAATSRGQPLHTAPYGNEPQALRTSNDSDLAELAGRTTPRSPSAENGAKHAYVDDDTPISVAPGAPAGTRSGMESR